MEKSSRKTSKTLRAVVLIAVLVVVALGVYAALTYPKTVVSFPVAFTIGADVEHREFDVPLLHGWVQVEVIVSSGTALWTAAITQKDETIWSHTAHQGGQTTYKSGWIGLPSGHYNFTFATAGLWIAGSRDKSNYQRRILVKPKSPVGAGGGIRAHVLKKLQIYIDAETNFEAPVEHVAVQRPHP